LQVTIMEISICFSSALDLKSLTLDFVCLLYKSNEQIEKVI